MGNQMPCCAPDAAKKDQDLLEQALKRHKQLDNDIRLARHNKLVNSSQITKLSIFSPKHDGEQSAATAHGSSSKQIEAKSMSRKKEKSRKALSKDPSKPKSILKQPSYQPTPKQIKDQVSPKMFHNQLTLKLNKLQEDNEQEDALQDQPTKTDSTSFKNYRKFHLHNRGKSWQMTLAGVGGADTENTTPSTVEERANKTSTVDDSIQNGCRMEDIFNSDDDLDQSQSDDNDQQNFTEISRQLRKNEPKRRQASLYDPMLHQSSVTRTKLPHITILASDNLNGSSEQESVQILSARVNSHTRANTTYNDLLSSLFSPPNATEKRLDGATLSVLSSEEHSSTQEGAQLSSQRKRRIRVARKSSQKNRQDQTATSGAV